MRTIHLIEITDWILMNRKKDAFKDYPANKIANLIKMSGLQGLLRVHTNAEEQIDGVVCGENVGGNLVVHDILTTSPGVFKAMVDEYKRCFAHVPLFGLRKGKLKQFTKKAIK